MKLICSKRNLLKSINISMKAVPSRTTMTILECILVDASGADIKLIANDMELGIQTTVPGIIEERGIIALNAQIFSNIVRKLPDADVIIRTDGEKVSIVGDKSKFAIMGRSGTDFVYLPAVEKNEEIRISQFSLRDMIARTIFSISGNESNGMMTGELLEIRRNNLRMVALDGHRIAIRSMELSDSYQDHKVIIPGKTLNEISKILSGDAKDMVTIYISDKHIMFEFDSTVVVSRLIEGKFISI